MFYRDLYVALPLMHRFLEHTTNRICVKYTRTKENPCQEKNVF